MMDDPVAARLLEDDPLIATPFAMSALAIARYVHTGTWRTAFDAGRPIHMINEEVWTQAT